MSTKNFTFDPESGVPNAADLVVYGGANFKNTFNVTNTSNEKYDLTGWSGSAQLQKSAGIGATTVPADTFTVGFTSAYDGKLKVSLGATDTRATAEGRYVYDVLLKHEVGSGSTIHPLISGNILVVNPISSAP